MEPAPLAPGIAGGVQVGEDGLPPAPPPGVAAVASSRRMLAGTSRGSRPEPAASADVEAGSASNSKVRSRVMVQPLCNESMIRLMDLPAPIRQDAPDMQCWRHA
jgi:hypothetical protein